MAHRDVAPLSRTPREKYHLASGDDRREAAGMLWKTRTRTLDLTVQGALMGVVNVTPDSFSDPGELRDVAAAVRRARTLAQEGALIIDVGGESTRPGANPVPEAEELARVLPVIEALASEPDMILSIDTMKPAVARAALAAGAEIVNDVSGLRSPEMRAVVKEFQAGAVCMHMQGTPMDMQVAPRYGDVVAEIANFFRQGLALCLACGIDPMRLAFDPGIGFGKTAEHNLALLANLDALAPEGRPLALGVSRKSFLGRVIGSTAMDDRTWPTVALTSFGRTRGARIFRVHEARVNAEALRMTEAILNPETAAV